MCGVVLLEMRWWNRYLFADGLNGENYLEFLKDKCEDLLNNLQLTIRRDVKYF